MCIRDRITLCVATIFAFIGHHSKRIAAEDQQAQNARILKEFKRIAIYRPTHIINYRKDRTP